MTSGTEHETMEERLLHRMLFFSDAVFAIVLTLLVLELKPPEGAAEATPATFRHMLPHLGAFAFSFFIGSVLWIAHMNTTRAIARFDWRTAVANLAFLLPVCLLPFATAWLGADLAGDFAFTLYAWDLVAISVANMALVLVAYRDGGRLILGGASPGEVSYRLFRSSIPGLSFAVGLLLTALGLTIVAHFCWLLIPVLFAAARGLKPKAA